MLDIYNFVVTNLFPTLPPELYFLIPIGCLVMLFIICFIMLAPFIVLLMLIRK